MTRYSKHYPSIVGNTTIEKLFTDFWTTDFEKTLDKMTSGYPVTDVYMEKDKQVIEMALAGFSKDMIKVDIETNKICISSAGLDGETKNRRIAKRKFSKEYVDYTHKLDLENSVATFENGLLRIEIPPKEKTISKKIEII
tara:strand:+ start:48 stop:467 length:420 start_codon:yes stop_codon:yes gene_type:complete